MSLWALVPIGCIFILLIFKPWISRSAFSLRGSKQLQRELSMYGTQMNIASYYLWHTGALSLVVGFGWMFELQPAYILILGIAAFLQVPAALTWHAIYRHEEYRFFQLTSFLQQLLAIFKTHPKLYRALMECRSSVDGKLAQDLDEWIANLDAGCPQQQSVEPFLHHQPHFIVGNLVRLMMFAEEFGGEHHLEGLEMIQDDIEDWIDDTITMKKNQRGLRNRILLLCGFALLIAMMSQNMLLRTGLEIDEPFRETTVFLFLMGIQITILMAQKLVSVPWISNEEKLWRS
ncbi:MAG: hypothetical protein E4G74_00540 [Erysipelotrichales bacterium]|nr:MAG: hypothetical protein E4G74_00540 [Erysipelotrichales bacterium]